MEFVISLLKTKRMTFEQTYELGKDNELRIKLPENFRQGKKVRVVVEEIDINRNQKIKMLEDAANDPLFLADVQKICEDFKHVDAEQ